MSFLPFVCMCSFYLSASGTTSISAVSFVFTGAYVRHFCPYTAHTEHTAHIAVSVPILHPTARYKLCTAVTNNETCIYLANTAVISGDISMLRARLRYTRYILQYIPNIAVFSAAVLLISYYEGTAYPSAVSGAENFFLPYSQ